jgi:dipeptidyl aminopeptidase/acylaminoacyl peptidase
MTRRTNLFFVAVMAIMLLGLAAGCAQVGKVVADQLLVRGEIVFQLGEDPWIMNSDGSSLRQAQDMDRDVDDLAWSPDLKKIVITGRSQHTESGGSECGGGSGCGTYSITYSYHDMVVMNANGFGFFDDVQRLERYQYGSDAPGSHGLGSYAREPAWSLDGKKIAYSLLEMDSLERDSVRSCDIYVTNTDGSGETRWLTTQPEYVSIDPRSFATREGCDTSPAWSPDGEKIAFASGRTGNGDIYVVNTSGGEGGGNRVQRLTDSPAVDDQPSWSPDGTEIAFTRTVNPNKSRNTDIYKVDADGSGETSLAHHRDPEHSPTWSPDGEQIAYVIDSYTGDRYSSAIHMMKSDGTDPTIVRKLPGKGAGNLYWTIAILQRISFSLDR